MCQEVRLSVFMFRNIPISSGKHVREKYTPLNTLLYSKAGVCRGIPIFLIFTPKHRICQCTHNLCFEQKIRKKKKKKKKKTNEISDFSQPKKKSVYCMDKFS